MANYKLVISYDGTRYKGWQKLGGNESTIQGILERVVGEYIDYPVELHGSGRTDAGVHARGQVASMKIPFLLKEDFIIEMNQRLPEDIRLLSVDKMTGDFHARYSATEKTYVYFVDTKEKADVFMRKYTCHYPEKLNLTYMQNAAKELLGEHDFSAFTDDKSDKDKVRTIYDIQITEERGIYKFVYRGDGFLQHMVRILTGTLLEIGSGNIPVEDIQKILQAEKRAAAGFMAPAKGLFLEKVNYD